MSRRYRGVLGISVWGSHRQKTKERSFQEIHPNQRRGFEAGGAEAFSNKKEIRRHWHFCIRMTCVYWSNWFPKGIQKIGSEIQSLNAKVETHLPEATRPTSNLTRKGVKRKGATHYLALTSGLVETRETPPTIENNKRNCQNRYLRNWSNNKQNLQPGKQKRNQHRYEMTAIKYITRRSYRIRDQPTSNFT